MRCSIVASIGKEVSRLKQEPLLRGRLSTMEQCALKNVNNYLNTNICPYLETSGGNCSNIYLNVVHFFNTKTYVAA